MPLNHFPTPDEFQELLTKVREIHAAMMARREQRTTSATPPSTPAARSAPPRAASAAPTTSAKHDPTDPVVKVMPRNWKGDDLRGRRFSECPPNFLGQLSHMLDAFADKNEQDPERERYAKWDRENAETARRWREKLEGKQDLFGKAPMSEREIEEAF